MEAIIKIFLDKSTAEEISCSSYLSATVSIEVFFYWLSSNEVVKHDFRILLLTKCNNNLFVALLLCLPFHIFINVFLSAHLLLLPPRRIALFVIF